MRLVGNTRARSLLEGTIRITKPVRESVCVAKHTGKHSNLCYYLLERLNEQKIKQQKITWKAYETANH